MDRIVLSLLVDNTSGVLSRVAGLFSRRGYNIESLTVGVTADERYSRMTVVAFGDQNILEQIEKQLRKLRRAVETVEAELAEIEKQIAAYDAKFAAATEYNEADYKAYNDLKARYDHQMHEWEKASYELEIVEEQG